MAARLCTKAVLYVSICTYIVQSRLFGGAPRLLRHHLHQRPAQGRPVGRRVRHRLFAHAQLVAEAGLVCEALDLAVEVLPRPPRRVAHLPMQAQAFAKKLKAGDEVVVTYSEAFAVSVEPVR